jgi:hypothetical protein
MKDETSLKKLEEVNLLIKDGKVNTDLIAEKMMEFPQATVPVNHYFSPGVYVREVKMPKGSLIMGHHHLHTHLNSVITGSFLFCGDDGSTSRVDAPKVFVAPPGLKILYILEDCIFQNIYANPEDEQDIDKLEDKYCYKTDEFRAFENEQLATQLLISSDNTVKYPNQPFGCQKFHVFRNEVYADGDIRVGERIGYASIGKEITSLGAHIGTSTTPNARIVPEDVGDALYAVCDISGKLGGLVKNKITIGLKE